MIRELSRFGAIIFNLDGVLVDTARYHYIAWRRLANEWDFDFSDEQHETLRWMSRMDSLEKVLEWGGITYMTEAEKLHWSDVKNNWYIELVANMQPDEVMPGVVSFLNELKSAGIKIALSSASRNARSVLQSIGLLSYFDVVIDGNIARKNKPDPESFLLAAHACGATPAQCIVFDDAPSGILAAQIAGFTAVGVGAPERLTRAQFVIPSLDGFSLSMLSHMLEPAASAAQI